MDSAAAATETTAQLVQKKGRERRKRFSIALSGVAVLASTLVTFGASLTSVMTKRVTDVHAEVQSRVELDRQTVQRLRQLQAEVAELRKVQASISQFPASSKTAVHLEALSAKVDAVTQRQDRLERAIQDNPEKALSMPLMRRDIDNMRDANAQSIGAIRASVDQIYDLTKWLLGALAVGVLSLALANFIQRKNDA